MADHLGSFNASSTIYFYFTTHAASGAAVAPSSGFEAADLVIYKNGSATQRSSASGITMTSPFDSVTGLHAVAIDLSDNTDASFYAAGSEYVVVLSPDETVDSLAVVKVLAYFSIERVVKVNVTQFGGSAGTFASGRPDVNTTYVGGTVQTARDLGASVLLSSGTGTGQISLSSGAVLLQATQTGVTIPTVTNLTNAPGAGDFTSTMKTSIGTAVAASAVASVTGAVGSIGAGGITATSIASDAITAAKIADGAIDTATFASGTTIPRCTLTDTVTTVTGLTASNLDTTVSSRMATYSQPTGFLAATFPGTVASPTNITAGTITTVTNLTNAATSGDLTATMKTSVNDQVVDALATDTYAEPGQGTPAATLSLSAKIGYLFKAWRNKSTQTSTAYNLFNDDAATVDQKATTSDDDTVFTRAEITSGP